MVINPELVAAFVAGIAGLIYFERRMTRVETKLDILLMQAKGGEE